MCSLSSEPIKTSSVGLNGWFLFGSPRVQGLCFRQDHLLSSNVLSMTLNVEVDTCPQTPKSFLVQFQCYVLMSIHQINLLNRILYCIWRVIFNCLWVRRTIGLVSCKVFEITISGNTMESVIRPYTGLYRTVLTNMQVNNRIGSLKSGYTMTDTLQSLFIYWLKNKVMTPLFQFPSWPFVYFRCRYVRI